MTNNDIIRRVRYLFNFSDKQVIELFKLANETVSIEHVSGWLKKEEDPTLIEISDRDLAVFLNGLIILKRGKKEGPQPEPEDPLSNNMILKKLKIALDLTSDDMLNLYASIYKPIGKHELSAFFRNPHHRKYEQCMDQYLRNFLNALQTKNKLGQHSIEPKNK
ncbi:DUF1456 family protein [Salibacteraceae bacterium]|nr:DUF1456 family protein [Salibacteraceae bacterium]MDB9709430.1 DUF1456 family protein [Salibacteraceae bacterium]MDC1303950.1 DUF1456 family protein [Salibacteraceae bacterium]